MSEVLLIIGQLDFCLKMFIKVSEKLADYLISVDDPKLRSRAIDVMVQLLTASRNNFHWVYIHWNLSQESENKVLSLLDYNSCSQYKYLKRSRIDVEALQNLLEVYVVIKTEGKSARYGKELHINPFENLNITFNESTYLATENGRDCKLFKYIADYYLKKNNMNNVQSIFRKWSGGGSDFGNNLKNDSIMSSNFLFAIADSDKWFEKDKIGKTAKSIMFIGHTRCNSDYYIMMRVMELENLIPINMINRNFDAQTIIKLNDTSYFDFKEGLKRIYLYEKESRSYWKRITTGLSLDWAEVENDVRGKSESDYHNEIRNKKPLINGFGSKLVEKILDKEVNNWDKVTGDELSANQRIEWETIGKNIVSWCFSPNNRC